MTWHKILPGEIVRVTAPVVVYFCSPTGYTRLYEFNAFDSSEHTGDLRPMAWMFKENIAT